MISQLSDEFTVKALCSVLDCAPSSYYYKPVEKADAPELVEQVGDLLAEKPFLGYRMTRVRLQRAGQQAPERAVRRILRSLKGKKAMGRVITTDSKHDYKRYKNAVAGVVANAPDHIWVADLTYIWDGAQFFYLAIVLDVYTRMVRGWQLEELLTCQALTLPALKMALQRGTPTFFHSDQGKQYAATAHTQLLENVGVTLSMSAPASPTQNAFVERFIRTFKHEHLYYSEYESVADMRRKIQQFLEVEYNCQRPHSALGYRTPQEFERDFYWQERLSSE